MNEKHDFRTRYETQVLPFYQSGSFGEFEGVDGIKIRHASFLKAGSRSALVVLPGKSETYLKYAELFFDLRDLPLSLYAMDHRGMGFSERMLPDPLKVHVECFDHYMEDFIIFLDTVVNAEAWDRLFLLGHSTGSLIAALYLERFPAVFQAAVLCSPFFELKRGQVPGFVLRLLGRLMDSPGRRREYGPGQSKLARSEFPDNTITHSFERWSLWEQEILPNTEAIHFGGVTNHWLRECLVAGRRAVRQAGAIAVPLLLLQAGQDSIVGLRAQDRFCRRAPNCRKQRIPGARHEILIEREDERSAAITRIKTFLNTQLA